jgi:hypothetical protein
MQYTLLGSRQAWMLILYIYRRLLRTIVQERCLGTRTQMHLSEFAYCRESLAKAEIKTCTKWQAICVDHADLKTKTVRYF